MTTSDPDLAALLAEVQSQAGERTLERFDHADGRRIGTAALRAAEEGGLPVVVSVMRGAQRVFHAGVDGTTAEHDDWVRRKINTAVRHDLPSLEIVLRHRISGRVPDWLDPREFAIAGGAVPVRVGSSTVGVIAVSGLVDSISADHDFAMAALREAGRRP